MHILLRNILLVLFCLKTWSALAEETVNIDIDSSPRQVRSMAGFLHGMNATTPAPDRLRALQPGLWRAGTLTKDIYQRATKAGARFTVVCSDYWGYDKQRRPLQHKEQFVALIKQIVLKTKDADIIYDIWNEPNAPDFSLGSIEEYCATFKLAHDTIRSVRPDAVIAGPSISGFVPKLLEQFLDFCLREKLKVQVLSWHDYRHGSDIAKIAPTLLEVRRRAIDSGKYAAVGVREIHINESMDRAIYLAPGSVLATLLAFELGKADAAGRSAWEEDFKNNLGGLLTQDTYQPRAVWWVYRNYAASLRSRVATKVTDSGWACAASVDREGETPELSLLIGRYALGGDPKAAAVRFKTGDISKVLRIDPDAEVIVTGKLIPPSGKAPLPEPREIPERRIRLVNGALSEQFQLPVEAVVSVRVKPGGTAR
jgi:xylan 1,4-beta-xylosidase